MLKIDFKRIFDEEIEFWGKRFDAEDKEAAYKRFLIKYYDRLSYLSEIELMRAFNKCRDNCEYFPKVKHILKFCQPPKTQEKEIIPKYVEPSQEVKKALASIAGTSKTKVGEKQLRENASLCARRWPNSNWDEPLKRWIEEDGFRK